MSTMLDLIAETPSQLRWAADLEVPAMPPARAGIVMGMGGSGIAGDAAQVVAAESGARVTVHKSYGLPGWASDELIVAISHSGNTEETASAVDAALAGSMSLVGITTGGGLAERAMSDGFPVVRIPAGPQPRAAFGYLAGAAVRIFEAAGVLGSQRAGLIEAADAVEEILEGDGPAMAEEIADSLVDRVAFVYGGSGVGSVAANRWKTQINENSKAPAAWIALPEGNHNDIVGWTGYPGVSAESIATVFLHDSGDHPRVEVRSRFTRELIESSVPTAGVVLSRGTGPLARLFSLVIIGDLVSVALTTRSGVDPMPVDVIQDLKARLAQENG